MELEELRQAVARLLEENGAPAMAAWPAGERPRLEAVTAAVSIRRWEEGPGSFQEYLGEKRDPDTGAWREVYGRKGRVTLGLDLYSPPALGEAGCQAAFERMCRILWAGGPGGLRAASVARGETAYEESSGLLRCPVEAVYPVYLYAAGGESGSFLDFDVKGLRT